MEFLELKTENKVWKAPPLCALMLLPVVSISLTSRTYSITSAPSMLKSTFTEVEELRVSEPPVSPLPYSLPKMRETSKLSAQYLARVKLKETK